MIQCLSYVLLLVIKPTGNKIQFTYGNDSNPTKEKWLVGTNVIETLNFQYDAVGKMTLASDTATSLEFSYTDGLLSREKQTLAPSIIAQSDYLYAGGQVREISLNLGASATFDSKVSYTYAAHGQVATLQQTGPTTETKSIRYSYDQAGNRVRTERFSDVGYATPIFETLSSYTNAQGQLKPTVQSIKHQRATGTVLSSYDFVWDAGNRLSSMTSSADGLTTYSYTPTNQLSAIDYANAPDQSFTCDLNGNWAGSGNVTGADNRLTSNATWDFVYDANGNMTRRTLKSDNSYIEYTYDHRDRLTDVRYRTSAGTLTKRVHFGYDALNRRYLQTVENGSGTILSTVYYVNQGFRKDRGDAGDEIALRLDGAGAVISRYLHGSLVDKVLSEENIGSDGARDVLWAMTDHQGSVRDLARVTSGTASVVNHIVYDAFGETVSETDAAIAHLYGYTGRELDKETGLQYNRARYLDLVLAHWISQDPIGFAGGDANLYRYVGNSPTNATDPSGLEGEWWRDSGWDYLNPFAYSAWVGNGIGYGGSWLYYGPSNMAADVNMRHQIKVGIAQNMGRDNNVQGTGEASYMRETERQYTELHSRGNYEFYGVATGMSTPLGGGGLPRGTGRPSMPGVGSGNPKALAPKGIEFPAFRPGDSITKALPDGSYPRWFAREAAEKANTIQGRYWMNRAVQAGPGEFTQRQLARMRAGFAPEVQIRVRLTDGTVEMRWASKELHHNFGNRGVPPFDEPIHLREVWPWQHSQIDRFRHTGYEFLGFVE